MEFSENKNDQSVLLDLTTRERRGKRGGGGVEGEREGEWGYHPVVCTVDK